MARPERHTHSTMREKKKRCAGCGVALLFLVVCVGLIVIVYLNSAEEDPALQVFVKQGALRGHHLTTRKGRHILAFQGIPYAKPPIGDLRFRSPQPFGKWKGVLDATQPVPKCVQRNVFVDEQEVSGQEDCLFINVYTPYVKGHHLLDVMVYIHGGGWLSGEGSSFQPSYLLDKDVVLVTFNYRLGPLGFLSTGDAVCPGNNGLKDQVAALRWVRDNIAAFGGNPSSVTIFGNGAGGASVQYHMLSPASRGLFHRAASQSGTAFCSWSLAPNGSSSHQAQKLAAQLGCPTQPSNALISCLRGKDAMDITATDRAYMEWSIYPLIPFKPVIEKGDDTFLPASPLELVRNQSAVPWITGVTSEEGAHAASRLYGTNMVWDMDAKFANLAPIALFYSETSSRKEEVSRVIRKFYFGDSPIGNDTVTSVVNMFTDGWFLQGAEQAVSLQSQTSPAPVFYYHFAYRGSSSLSTTLGDATRNYGVCHGDELIYLFPFGNIFPGTKLTEEDEKIVDIMTTLWTNFAHSGNPTPAPYSGVQWPQVSTPHHKEYIQIDKDGLKSKRGLLEERAAFWKDLPLVTSPTTSVKDEI